MQGFKLSLPLSKVVMVGEVAGTTTPQPIAECLPTDTEKSNSILSVPLLSKLNLSSNMSNTAPQQDNIFSDDISEDEDIRQKSTDFRKTSFFSSISIDNDPVEIENITKLQSSSSPQYTSNIKIYECLDDSPLGTESNKPWKRDFKSKACPLLLNGRDSKFKVSSCYIVIHLFNNHPEQSKNRDETGDENNFRIIEQLFTWGTIGSLKDNSNDLSFTPRGLEHPFSSSRVDQNNKFNFDLYVWYGKESTDFVKSRTIEKALKLESILQQPTIVENLFSSGKPQSFEELIKSGSDTFLSNASSIQTSKHHLLSRIRSLMMGKSNTNLSKHLFDELSATTPADDNSNEKFNNLLQLRKRPMAGVTNHEDSLESPRKKERTQLSPINTREVEHVEEPKVMSGRELAKACHYVCSKITDFLFLGSAAVAQDKKKLNDNGITHIINAAASVYCDNYFPNDFTYHSLSLYDDPNESIIGSFYGVIDFIENAIKKGGKVYVHCQMGVSRSCCLCISYMMWKYRMNFNQALEDVKSKRACCSPNAGFLVQLTQWETILGLSDKSKKEPNAYLYRISPLNNFYAIHKELVPKLCHNTRHLDSRTCFLLQSKNHLFLWVGTQSTSELLDAANTFIEILRSYSPKSLSECIQLQEGQENEEFNQILTTLEIDNRRMATEYQDLKYLQMNQEEAIELMKQIRTTPTDSSVDSETEKEMKNYKTGTLYSYEDGSFSEFDYFDSEDILDDMCYVMLPENEDHILVMVGYDVDLGDGSLDEMGEEIAKLFIGWKKLPESTSIRVCEEDDPDFFRYFKNG